MKQQHRPATERPKSVPAERVYGLAAARAAFEARPESVLSIAHSEALRHALADMLRKAAKRRIAYREVPDDELSRMAQSVHHEGVCLLVRPGPVPTSAQLFRTVNERDRGLVLALDGVQNPHNIGAILRSAAYFQAAGLVCADAGKSEKLTLSAAARRVAEGGAEFVPVVKTAALPQILQEAKQAGLVLIGSDAHAETKLASFRWPARALLVLGHEQHGLSREVRASCQHLLQIPGSEHIDSLNVSVAAGIFLASYAASTGDSRA